MRIAALQYVFRNFNNAQPGDRALSTSLLLGAVSIHMLNALNSRPAEGKEVSEMLEVCCQHIPVESGATIDNSDDENEPELRPILYDRGLYFISDLVIDDGSGIYRMPRKRRMHTTHLTWLYGRNSFHMLEADIGITVVMAPKGSLAAPGRSFNRRKRTMSVAFARNTDEPNNHDFGLANMGIVLRPKPRERGPDTEEFTAYSSDEDNDENIDEVVSRIWVQLPYDIFAISANGKKVTSPSYLIMSREERCNITLDIFKSLDMSALFEKVQIRRVSMQFWKDTLFPRFFPPKRSSPKEQGKHQNFPYTRYYADWVSLMKRLSEKDSEIVRRKLWEQFKTLKWFLHGASDRMWATKVMQSSSWTAYPLGIELSPSPHIAVNETVAGRESIIMGIRPVLEGEEGTTSLDPDEE